MENQGKINENGNNQNEKQVTLKNKKIITILILLVVFIILTTISYSLFTDTKNEEKNLKIGKVEVVLEEDEEWQENEDEYGIEKYTKSVKGVSVADLDAYVRIRCIPIIQYFDEKANNGEGEWITAAIDQNEILLAINTEDWVQEGDYWYYTKVLKGYEETEKLNIDWQILEVPTQIMDKNIRADVRVILEYAQASNNMWKSIFQIEELPQQVERIQ